MGRHGGGAFSGKDPSKVDRSACYAARWVAKNIVAAGLARRCEVQLAYAIGVAEPVSVMVDTFGTSEIPEADIMSAVRETFDLTPRGIIDGARSSQADLFAQRPRMATSAARRRSIKNGRGSSTLFTWERTDRAAALKKAVNVRRQVSSARLPPPRAHTHVSPSGTLEHHPRQDRLMVEVTVARLGLDSSTNSYVVILQEKGGVTAAAHLDRTARGRIDRDAHQQHQARAAADARPLQEPHRRPGRPARRVQITKVQKSTYFAELHIMRGDVLVQIDARPSDSIAVALRLSAPIFAQESLAHVRRGRGCRGGRGARLRGRRKTAEELSAEQLKQYLENLRPEDFGKFNL